MLEGDAIATRRPRKGILSPLADSTMIAALYNIRNEINTFLGMFGFGSDGELTLLKKLRPPFHCLPGTAAFLEAGA